jgi:two-component system alkaline phosphatase synthesis response regulator PhoP
MPQRILLVEDDAGLALTVSDRLRNESYEVEIVHDGQAGLHRASTERFDLILLDWTLPKRSGIDVCRDLRQMKIGTPILMLTARGQTTDKVIGLRLGADDYLTKPFDMQELLARVEALMRRSSPREEAPSEVWQSGAITVDRRRTRVTRNGKIVDLAPREYKLLCYFLDHASSTISREELLREVWSYHFIPSTRTVDVHVGSLRQKLEDDPKQPKLILTVQGRGYCLSPTP